MGWNDILEGLYLNIQSLSTENAILKERELWDTIPSKACIGSDPFGAETLRGSDLPAMLDYFYSWTIPSERIKDIEQWDEIRCELNDVVGPNVIVQKCYHLTDLEEKNI